jgi:hypothetical protein
VLFIDLELHLQVGTFLELRVGGPYGSPGPGQRIEPLLRLMRLRLLKAEAGSDDSDSESEGPGVTPSRYSDSESRLATHVREAG